MSTYAEIVAMDYLLRNAKADHDLARDLVKAKTHEWVVLSRSERYDTIVLRGPEGDRFTLHLIDGRVTSHD